MRFVPVCAVRSGRLLVGSNVSCEKGAHCVPQFVGAGGGEALPIEVRPITLPKAARRFSPEGNTRVSISARPSSRFPVGRSVGAPFRSRKRMELLKVPFRLIIRLRDPAN